MYKNCKKKRNFTLTGVAENGKNEYKRVFMLDIIRQDLYSGYCSTFLNY